jgi:hypothetical protein
VDDWTTLVKNAVAVLVILLAISVVLFLAYLGVNAANAGGERLADTTATMDARTFASFDQTTMRGTGVINAIQQFAGQPVSIVVVTNRSSPDAAVLFGAAIGDTGAPPDHAAVEWTDFDFLAISEGAGVIEGDAPMVQRILIDPTQSTFGEVQNNNTAVALQPANAHYINRNAQFASVLLYDANDRIIGMYIEQISGTAIGDRLLRD